MARPAVTYSHVSAEGCGFTWEFNYSSGGRREGGGAGLEGMDSKSLHWACGVHANTRLTLSGILAQTGHRPPLYTENLAESHLLPCLLETPVIW